MLLQRTGTSLAFSLRMAPSPQRSVLVPRQPLHRALCHLQARHHQAHHPAFLPHRCRPPRSQARPPRRLVHLHRLRLKHNTVNVAVSSMLDNDSISLTFPGVRDRNWVHRTNRLRSRLHLQGHFSALLLSGVFYKLPLVSELTNIRHTLSACECLDWVRDRGLEFQRLVSSELRIHLIL